MPLVNCLQKITSVSKIFNVIDLNIKGAVDSVCQSIYLTNMYVPFTYMRNDRKCPRTRIDDVKM